ncbi:MAG: CinA family protein [Promethearchaeota archaeon]
MLLERIERIIKEFSKRGITLAIAESCTGGFISHMITNISGASKVFERGIICYSNQAKINLLKVNPKIIEKHGAVSELVALQMAKHIKEQSSVDIGIGITGIAGPTGGTKEKPVGLVYIGISTIKETTVKKFIFKSDRIGFKESALKKILELLERYIKNNKNNLISEKF